ncbi:hypothetical protein CHL78_012270 [Romboutsia weinsteinii]|uniref:Uncharacterized protein n=1 Tax=Romboutsia weinsteinii TaxID=2020949 RepID=A0A371J1N4_9FIRM|nr:hypothetical protein [Romboutsia weinsteinii]RDY26721.1 hypothetical protein CHL78_012270 [Romboutsia weinsteinii]
MSKNNLKGSFPKVPKEFHDKLSETLNNLPEREEGFNMINNKKYKLPFKRGLAAALVATLTLGTTAFAVGKIASIVGSTSTKATYTSIPTEDEIKKDFKFTTTIVDEFDNGYKFDGGYTSNVEGLDENNNVTAKSKELRIDYKKGNDEIYLNTADKLIGESDENLKIVDTYGDIKISYLESEYKFVPVDYELTEQDKIDEKSGKYIFSYGSDKVEVSEFKYLSWEKDGVYYSFNAQDLNISMDDLVEMAYEVIDKN